jgi:hypothetical protein
VAADDIRQLETGSFLILTGDENLIQVNVASHYQVRDAANYLFNLEDPAKLVRDATRSALRQVLGLKIPSNSPKAPWIVGVRASMLLEFSFCRQIRQRKSWKPFGM